MKKLFVLLTITALAVSFTACGPQGSKDGNADGTTKTETGKPANTEGEGF